MLTRDESIRYARHISLSEIGVQGQEKLKNAKILIVGLGGLGSPLALYLSAAGLGTIGIMDDDLVSLSNLQRQILYNCSDVGRAKVFVAEQKLKALNPMLNIITYNFRLNHDNASSIIAEYDLVVDACDNIKTRYDMDEACLSTKTPYVYASIAEFTGQIAVFNYNGGKSYNDLFPKCDELCETTHPSGVVGVLPGIIACLQANEVLKIICSYGDVLSNKLLLYNALKNTFDILNI